MRSCGYGDFVPTVSAAAEDSAASAVLGARSVHERFPERLLRHFGSGTITEVNAQEESEGVREALVESICTVLARHLDGADRVYLPAGKVPHPDHRLVVEAAQRLEIPAARYEEMPYCCGSPVPHRRLPFGAESMGAKLRAAQCYRSQMAVLFGGAEQAAAALTARASALGGGSAYTEGLHPSELRARGWER